MEFQKKIHFSPNYSSKKQIDVEKSVHSARKQSCKHQQSMEKAVMIRDPFPEFLMQIT